MMTLLARASLEGLTLEFEDRGSGKPLLLIGGIPSVGNDWDPLADLLSPSRRVITFDNRGCGGSTVTPGPYTTRQLAGDAVALLDHLAIERADVFGMSLGGMIAQELVLGWPQRVDRLVLGCTHCGIAHAEPPPKETARAFALQTDDWGERMRTLAPFAFSRTVDSRFLESFIEKKSGDVQDPRGYAAQLQAALDHDTYDRLPGIEAPCLVVTGDDDRTVPAGSSRPLAERIPDARLRVIEGAGHVFFAEKPGETRDLLERFLQPRGSGDRTRSEPR